MKGLLLGNEAIARGAYQAGVTVATAYPGTPSTEITEYISKYNEIYSEWSPNEKVALEVAIGASIAGARAICSMKHVGLNVAADPLFTASYTGINGGLVIVVADDPGMHSSQNEQDTRNLAYAAKIPLIEPSDSQECLDFVIEAFKISEKFDTPVIVRLTTRVAHSRSIVQLGERTEHKLCDYKKNSAKYVMVPSNAKNRRLEVERRMAVLSEYSDICNLNQMELNKTKIGVISSGIAYQYAREAIEDASFLKLGMLNPLPKNVISHFASMFEKVYIVEELDPYIENYAKSLGLNVIGKDVLPAVGELSVNAIKKALVKKEYNDFYNIIKENKADIPSIPQRPPVMCPGCPHRGTFKALNNLKLNVSGDIGCYTLGVFKPLDAMDICECMGASIGIAHGMEKARGKDMASRTVAVIGDSTFIHSGITGLIDVVYNKGISTVIVLDNSITGMTGHQQNPLSGFTIKNEPTVKVDLAKLAEAIGINRVRVVDPFDIEATEKVVKEEVETSEPSLVIARRPCALLKGVSYNGVAKVNQDKCVKCKLCMSLGCPAIELEGNRVIINDALCVGCGLCIRVCRFNAFEKEERN